MIKKLKFKSEFSRNIITLMTGTAVAQAIPLAISPILTRIYSPEDFGIFAIYMAIVSICVVIATGRYEMAIMLPQKDEDVKSIVKLILLILTIVTSLIFFLVFFFNKTITGFFENPEISSWLYFLPVSIFLVGLYQVYNYLLIRKKSFKRLSTNKVLVSSINSSTQLTYGFTVSNGFGLLVGNIVSYILSIYFIVKSRIVNEYFNFKGNSINKVAKEYQKFPKYDIPSVLVNVFANQLPLFVLGKYFGLGIVGFYSLMYKVLMMPIGLLSNSILDVFKQRATEDYNKYGNCKEIFIKTLISLVLIGFVPFTFLGFFAPEVFSFIFGSNWKTAGEFAQIMTPMLYLKFIINPLSYTFYVTHNQKKDLIGQVLLLIIVIIAIYIGLYYKDEKILLLFFSLGYSSIYLLYLVYSYILSKGVKK